MNEALIEVILDLVSKENYDAILITYSYWGDIVKALESSEFKGKKIIDVNDFLTLQQYYSQPQLRTDEIGTMFGSEIERMRQFDEIIHISYDELLLFSNFIPDAKHYYIPQFFLSRECVSFQPAKYDILFIGSNNSYNIEGISWFFETVYPLLDKGFTIAIAGNICNHVLIQEENVNKLGFVENAAELFSVSRCTICPLKKGSGLKIKVVESLSFGLPVVSTSKGVDGFYNKRPAGGILVSDDPSIFATHIENLLNDPVYYEQQCGYAESLFTENFSVESNFSKLDEIFKEGAC